MEVTLISPLTRLPAGRAAAGAAVPPDNAAAAAAGLTVVGDALDVGGTDEGLLRGHGTLALHPPAGASGGGGGGGDGGGGAGPALDHTTPTGLAATLTGAVTRVDRLVSVRPLDAGRYAAELGDVVVGRVTELGGRRWRLDLGGRAEAALLLAAAGALPGGGSSRRKTAEDEAAMRSLFAEGDLLAAEVQALHGDGSVLVHTRSRKYGRLAGGQVVAGIPPPSIRRLPRQFNALPALGVDVIFGLNGWVWVGPSGSVAGLHGAGGGGGGGAATTTPFGAILGDEEEEEEEDEQGEGDRASDPYPAPPPPTSAARAAVARVAAAVRTLAAVGLAVDPAGVEAAVRAADGRGLATADMEGDAAFLEGLVTGG